MLVVWDDDPEHIIDRAEQIEQHLVGMIWRSEGMKDDGDCQTALAKATSTSRTPTININATEALEHGSEPNRHFSNRPRRVLLFQPILMAITGILLIFTIGVGWRKIAIELKVDHRRMRCLLIVVVPLQIWLGWVSHAQIITRCRLTIPVLLSNTGQRPGSSFWPSQPGDLELEVLFRHTLSTNYSRLLATCHSPNARVQGRSLDCH
jgi:hypothetical protein